MEIVLFNWFKEIRLIMNIIWFQKMEIYIFVMVVWVL